MGAAQTWRAEAREAIDAMPDRAAWTRKHRAALRSELAALGLRKGDRAAVTFGSETVTGRVHAFAVRPMERGGSLLVILHRDGADAPDGSGFYAADVRKAVG